MTKEALDSLLEAMLQGSDGISDLLFVADKPPVTEHLVIRIGLLKDPIYSWFLKLDQRPVGNVVLVIQNFMLIRIRIVGFPLFQKSEESEIVGCVSSIVGGRRRKRISEFGCVVVHDQKYSSPKMEVTPN